MMRKKWTTLLVTGICLLMCGVFFKLNNEHLAPYKGVQAAQIETNVIIETNHGDIVLALNKELAPITVENFLHYANSGYYNGTIFHRVIPGFMIQGGGFTQEYARKKTRPPIVNEANNGLENQRGSIAMARTSDPNSATAQFFINVANNRPLNRTSPQGDGYGYAVFGRVIEGMDIVDKIAQTPTGSGGPFSRDVPREPVIMTSVRVVE